MAAWDALFAQARPAFAQNRTFERARTLALTALASLGRKTITQMLCACGQQFVDWSAGYRLFERERFDADTLWQVALSSVLETLPKEGPVVALMDDTLTRKKGHKIEGTSWRRDPLGPAFRPNFVWSSRYLQLSVVVPQQIPGQACVPARAIPVDLRHCPSPHKPARRADAATWQAWREAAAPARISTQGAARIGALRNALDQYAHDPSRPLWICADATFTNATVLKNLPDRTVLIGRIRKDARLYAVSPAEAAHPGRGRRRLYGERLPTPEAIRQDPTVPWHPVRAFAAGREFLFKVKTLTPVRWKQAGGQADLRLLIVSPLAYRLRKHEPLNYRSPAYLICTDPSVPVEQVLQAYLWRWEIEVNFRDEKTLLGLGQAQVRTRAAIEASSSFVVFTYALLLLALERTRLLHRPLPRPVWQRPNPKREITRTSTSQALSLFRSDLWGTQLGLDNKSGFARSVRPTTKPRKIEYCLRDAVLYAMN